MQTSIVFAILSAVAVMATPMPMSADVVPSTIAPVILEPGVASRVVHLYVCDSADFKGRCENLDTNTGQCYNLYNNWSDTISSLGPDTGTSCTIYDDYDCQGRTLSGIVNPGITNLVTYNFNDIASAYRCS